MASDLPIGVAVTDQELRVQHWSSEMELITEINASLILGESLRTSFSESDERARLDRIWELLLAGNEWHDDWIYTRYDGKRFNLHVKAAPLFDEEANVLGMVLVVQGALADISGNVA